jgi:hypothetical protein
MAENVSLMRLLTCLVAAVVYVWQEQQEFLFSPVHFPIFVLGIGILSIAVFHFQRGRSPIQPPEPISGALRFIGHRSLEIYTIQLAGSELIIILWPGIAP